MNGQQLQQGLGLKPFNPLPMAGPLAPPSDTHDSAPC